MDENANLGLATTGELLDELIVRFEIPQEMKGAGSLLRQIKGLLKEEELAYRTIDH